MASPRFDVRSAMRAASHLPAGEPTDVDDAPVPALTSDDDDDDDDVDSKALNKPLKCFVAHFVTEFFKMEIFSHSIKHY